MRATLALTRSSAGPEVLGQAGIDGGNNLLHCGEY
jgi:hypothetical protein